VARAISVDDSASRDSIIARSTGSQPCSRFKGAQLTASVFITLLCDAILLEHTSAKDDSCHLIAEIGTLREGQDLSEAFKDDCSGDRMTGQEVYQETSDSN